MNDQPGDSLEDITPPGEEVIVARPWLLADPAGRRGPSYIAAVVLTACFHAYVLAFLPAVLFYELLAAEPGYSVELDNDEIGNDPDLPTNYVADRIEEVSIPGEVHPEKAVGIAVLLDEPPASIPPPPGFRLVNEVKFTEATAGFPSASPSKSVSLGLPPALAGGFPQGELDNPPPQGAGPAGGLGGPEIRLAHFTGESGATRERMIRESSYSLRTEREQIPAPAQKLQLTPPVEFELVLPSRACCPPVRFVLRRGWR